MWSLVSQGLVTIFFYPSTDNSKNHKGGISNVSWGIKKNRNKPLCSFLNIYSDCMDLFSSWICMKYLLLDAKQATINKKKMLNNFVIFKIVEKVKNSISNARYWKIIYEFHRKFHGLYFNLNVSKSSKNFIVLMIQCHVMFKLLMITINNY